MAAEKRGTGKKASEPSGDIHDDIKRQVIFGVGYGKPPMSTRFVKGRSGNSAGRPRKAAPDLSMAEQPMLSAALKGANKMIAVREGGKATEIPAREAIVQTVILNALKGNARSQGLAMDLFRTADEAHAREIRQRNEIWERYKALTTAELAGAKQRGEPEPRILPHPDDIVIDSETGPKFLGPLDEDEQQELERTLQLREILVMQDALDQRSSFRVDGTPFNDPGTAMVLAMLLEKCIPPRLRLSELEWIRKQFKYEGTSKRTLLKLLFTAWRKVGRPRPRGYLSPDLKVVKKWFEDMAALRDEVETGNLDLDAMARGEFNEAALNFMDERGLH
ncbi:DUF5681 domain-containing protein [Mesorhizobium sp. STM 4661]|uniref:DUF5681 domain-containing protein n=1 Tax=Mesorhizobium sp. STM 4661 TaxID=1297570 RepID=UPI0002BFCEDC|nr:DUF5681 domain-containing protein [Mesorhizobium sp. STM 4661]CCV11211.1 hypothetical protein MESS4_290022 [Mesorhizobium sp. STM 4661]